MRFPNAKEVDRACHSGSMRMKTTEATLEFTHCTSSVGSKGDLQKAWVKVSKVPSDKRIERNVAYAASLVGVPLEIDLATLHHLDSVRVLLGCADMDKLPPSAKGVLGDHFMTFTMSLGLLFMWAP